MINFDFSKFDFLTTLAYAIVAITAITMVFGIMAYSVYKAREIKRARLASLSKQASNQKVQNANKYLFFEEKEVIL